MLKSIIKVLGWIIGFCICFVLAINAYVCLSTHSQINKDLENPDCILVLGAAVKGNEPSPMLSDRLDSAIELYNQGKAPKIIMSGDHSDQYYNEVKVMKKYAINKGLPSSDIFMDHAGLSTYESLYRAKNLFQAKRIIIVTQKYHLYRALYIANSLGIEAVGVPSNPRSYSGQILRDIREIAARYKDFFSCFIQPRMQFSETSIPVSGNGDITNDESFEQ